MWLRSHHFVAFGSSQRRCRRCIWSAQHCWSSNWTRLTYSRKWNSALYLYKKQSISVSYLTRSRKWSSMSYLCETNCHHLSSCWRCVISVWNKSTLVMCSMNSCKWNSALYLFDKQSYHHEMQQNCKRLDVIDVFTYSKADWYKNMDIITERERNTWKLKHVHKTSNIRTLIFIPSTSHCCHIILECHISPSDICSPFVWKNRSWNINATVLFIHLVMSTSKIPNSELLPDDKLTEYLANICLATLNLSSMFGVKRICRGQSTANVSFRQFHPFLFKAGTLADVESVVETLAVAVKTVANIEYKRCSRHMEDGLN